jgi:hypothetical protein
MYGGRRLALGKIGFCGTYDPSEMRVGLRAIKVNTLYSARSVRKEMRQPEAVAL